MEDYYKILGLERDATPDQIKKAYRNLAKTHHPDVGGNEEEFKKISTAYEVLSDEQKRANYDNGGNNRFDPFMGGGFGFNPFTNQQVKGRDIKIDLTLTLEEIYRGVSKKIKFNHLVGCETCSGTGGKDSMCDGCNGHGVITQTVNTPMGRMMNQRMCGKCRGTGRIIIDPCKTCNGGGAVIKSENITIDVPQGVHGGHAFLVRNGGDYVKNGPSGDLYIIINELNTPMMYRQGNDIVKKISLSYVDFILGNDYILETFDGKIKINIPELSNIGDNLRIKGKGFKNKDVLGDMILLLDLTLPKQITEEEKELLQQIKTIKKA